MSEKREILAAVVKENKGEFEFESLLLDPPRPNEILVKVVACGVCHTDLVSKGADDVPKPMVFGHEGTGIVEAVGNLVRRVQVGDHVTMSFYSCGNCGSCSQGCPGYCDSHYPINFHGTRLEDGSTNHTTKSGEKVYGSYFRQSAFATYAICTERNIVKIPKDFDFRIAGPLGCGIQTGAGAVMNTFKCGVGSKIAIFGAGGVGLSAVLAARACGSTTIIAVDLVQDRLDLAKELGATHVVRGDDPDIKQKLKDWSDGGLEFCLDTTANPHVLKVAFESLRQKGVAAMIGGPKWGTALQVDLVHLLNGRSVRGIIQGDSVPDVFIPKLIELYRQGKFPYDKLIKVYKFDEINQAAKDSLEGRTIKPVVIIAPELLTQK